MSRRVPPVLPGGTQPLATLLAPTSNDTAATFDPRLAGGGRKQRMRHNVKFDFIDRGKFQLQAEFERVRREQGEEAAAAALKEKKAELRKQVRLEEKEALKEERERQREMAKEEAIRRENEAAVLAQEHREHQETIIPIPSIPLVEWWDAKLLPVKTSYEANVVAAKLSNTVVDTTTSTTDEAQFNLKPDRISHYIEHPVPVEPPAEAPEPAPRPLTLLPKEIKKLRKQRREAKEKEKQDLIRQGLLEPPKPKVRLSNLMRVLGAESAADPTAVEQEVRRQMAERLQSHADHNEAMKLTPAERREKKLKKMFNPSEGGEVHVAVYRVGNLVNRRNQYKVRTNANQNELTGRCFSGPGGTGIPFGLVVVEGCTKSLQRFERLMMHRIRWTDVLETDDPVEAARQDHAAHGNYCTLVWRGTTLEKAYDDFKQLEVKVEELAVQDLAQAGVEHYWTLARESSDLPPTGGDPE